MQATATRLVEREAQLAAIADAFGDGGTAVLVEGEAGAGKSAVLGDALHDLPLGVSVWRGQCEPLAVPAPFSALFEMLSALPDEIGEAVRSGRDVIEIYSSILAVMRRRPVVLVLDDLQWADAATAGLARYVGRRLGDTPSTMACAFRRDELDSNDDVADVIAELGRVGTRIELPPLTVGAVTTLAGHIAPDRAVDAAAIHRTTGGNPLFVVEALRAPAGDLPASVGDLVVAQVRRLPIGTQQVVEMIALCPDGLALDGATTLTADAAGHIDIACERRVLSVTDQRVDCRHELLRSAIDRAIPPMRRRQLHSRLVEVLEPIAGQPRDVAHLAYHAAEAGLARPAVDHSLRAARTAVQAGAHREAAELYTQALRFRSAMSPIELDQTLGDAYEELLLTGRLDAAERLIDDRTATSAAGVGQTDVRVQRLQIMSARGRCFDTVPLAEAMLDEHPGPGGMTRVLAARTLAGVFWTQGRHGDAVRILQQMLAEVEATGDRDSEARLLAALGSVEASMGFERGGERLTAGLQLAAEIGADEHAAFALNNLTCDATWTFDLPAARQGYAAGIGFTFERQLDSWVEGMHSNAGVLELLAGDWDAALEHVSFDLDPDSGVSSCSGREGAYVAATVHLRRGTTMPGELSTAIDVVDDDLSYFEVVPAVELAMEAAWCGQWDLADAAARRDAMVAHPGLHNDPYGRAHIAFWSLRCFGDAAVADAPGAVGLEMAGDLEGAAACWDHLGVSYYAALTRADLPDPPVAAVLAALTDLGASTAIETIRSRWVARGVVVDRVDAHPSGLTARQLDVLALIGEPCTNAEIAERLFISEKTVGHHVSAILARLDVPTRWAAANLAADRGWVCDPTE